MNRTFLAVFDCRYYLDHEPVLLVMRTTLWGFQSCSRESLVGFLIPWPHPDQLSQNLCRLWPLASLLFQAPYWFQDAIRAANQWSRGLRPLPLLHFTLHYNPLGLRFGSSSFAQFEPNLLISFTPTHPGSSRFFSISQTLRFSPGHCVM